MAKFSIHFIDSIRQKLVKRKADNAEPQEIIPPVPLTYAEQREQLNQFKGRIVELNDQLIRESHANASTLFCRKSSKASLKETKRNALRVLRDAPSMDDLRKLANEKIKEKGVAAGIRSTRTKKLLQAIIDTAPVEIDPVEMTALNPETATAKTSPSISARK